MGDWIICCQGTTQLLTAAAAVKAYAALNSYPLRPDQVVVLVFDLACPQSRLDTYRRAIIEIAHTNYGWSRVEILDLDCAVEAGGDSSRELLISPSSKPEAAEVVFSCRSNNLHDIQVMQYFRNATQVCYGDSVGLYTDPHYLQSRARRYSRAWSSLKRAIKGILAHAGLMAPTIPATVRRTLQYEMGLFSLAEAGGCKPPFEVRKTDVDAMLDGYRSLAGRLRETVLAAGIVSGGTRKSLAVLLTSTQSEWGRMAQVDEVRAYLNFVREHIESGMLLLKPHPRENKDKIASLKAALTSLGYQIFDFECSDKMAVMPVEVILLLLKEFFDLKVLATTSASYGVALVCEIESVIGFGNESVKKYFKPEFWMMRIRHEKLLRSYTRKFLRMNKSSKIPSHKLSALNAENANSRPCV